MHHSFFNTAKKAIPSALLISPCVFVYGKAFYLSNKASEEHTKKYGELSSGTTLWGRFKKTYFSDVSSALEDNPKP